MTRHFALVGLAVLVGGLAGPVSVRADQSPTAPPVAAIAAGEPLELVGVVRDDQGRPLAGAAVSATGRVTVSTTSDATGRFAFTDLAQGPYLLRARLATYQLVGPQLVQVGRALGASPEASLILRRGTDQEVPALAAGLGPVDSSAGTGSKEPERSPTELSWRLRHLKRSVLKDAAVGVVDSVIAGGSGLTDSFDRARMATALFADVPWNGQFDLLTTTSFDRPEDLLSMQTWLPRGVAFLSLEAPTSGGQWTMRGALTQGDLSSWIATASYRRAPSAHRYETGVSYGLQRYLGGNAQALAAVADGDRNAGAIYASDDWALSPRLSVTYGAKYSRYDYLATRGLFSPHAGVTLTPRANDSLRISATATRREIAPGAEEFVPSSTGMTLPPERTFSALSGTDLVAERLDHTEVAAEREWAGRVVTGVRVFRQSVDDQIVTVFGPATGASSREALGHYYVASAGDFEAKGWGVSVSRAIPGRARATIAYTNARALWIRPSPSGQALLDAAVQPDTDGRLHDVTTTVEGTVPVTDTRVFVVYKVNSHFARMQTPGSDTGARFDLRVHQALPFMRFSGSDWEMLVAVRSLFRDESVDASIFDELLVVRSPKRVVGGVTVRF